MSQDPTRQLALLPGLAPPVCDERSMIAAYDAERGVAVHAREFERLRGTTDPRPTFDCLVCGGDVHVCVGPQRGPYFRHQLKQVVDKKHMEQVAFLKENLGMGHRHANAIVAYTRKGGG